MGPSLPAPTFRYSSIPIGYWELGRARMLQVGTVSFFAVLAKRKGRAYFPGCHYREGPQRWPGALWAGCADSASPRLLHLFPISAEPAGLGSCATLPGPCRLIGVREPGVPWLVPGPRTTGGRWATGAAGPERGPRPSGKRGTSALSCPGVKPYGGAGTSTTERPGPPPHLQPFRTPPRGSQGLPAAAVREFGADWDHHPSNS